jgi:hypothetical protein
MRDHKGTRRRLRFRLMLFYLRIPCVLVLVHSCVCLQLSSPRRTFRSVCGSHSQSRTKLFSSTAPDQDSRGARTWVQRRPRDHVRSPAKDGIATHPPLTHSQQEPFARAQSSVLTNRSATRTVLSPVVPSAATVAADRTQNSPLATGRRRKTKPLPITGYDAAAIEEYFNGRPLQVGWRLNSIGLPLFGTRMMANCAAVVILAVGAAVPLTHSG